MRDDIPGWVKHATVWLLIGVAVFLGIRWWETRALATRFVVDGGTLEIARGPDGHYRWPGNIGGRAVEFLIDTGATRTALPAALASELGLRTIATERSMTAGGAVVGTRVVGDVALRGGVRADRLAMVALPQLDAPLLGMDVLGRLHWQQRDGVLRIDLHDGPVR